MTYSYQVTVKGRETIVSAAVLLIGSLLGLAGPARGGQWKLVPTPEAIARAAGRIVGRLEVEQVRSEPFVRLGKVATIVLPTEGLFSPKQGTITFHVRPTWAGNDGRAHAFFHLGNGNAHVTVFKTDSGLLRFVYKASPTQYVACDVDVTSWQPGQAHEIAAGWVENYAGQLFLQLHVDGRRVLKSGAEALHEVPREMFLGRRGPKAQPAEAWIGAFCLSDRPPKLPYTTGPKTEVLARVDCRDTKPLRRVHDFTTIWNSRDNPLPFQVGDPEYERFRQAGFHMVRLVAFSEGWL